MRSVSIAVGLLAVGLAVGLTTSAWGQTTAGVAVDAQGVLEMRVFTDPGGQVMRERVAAARAALDAKIQQASKMRKISLNRLEKALSERDGQITDEMRYLAGIQRIRYVFYYPESHDIVIAGPAEGWVMDLAGRAVGMRSGRPACQLQDLVAALRAYGPGKSATQFIGCSIDPTEKGLADMQRFLKYWGSQAVPAQTAQLAEGLRTSLGAHTVSVMGVSPKTHFAQVMVEADYRMKLIGIGLEKPPVKLVSYVDRATPAQVTRNALERWYFVPDYQCIRVTGDKLGAELVGDGVKLVGEGELVSAEGGRTVGVTNKASQLWVQAFTKAYPDLAEKSPVYAELRNLIDMAVAAAFIQKQDYYGKAGWKMPVLGNEKSFPIETFNVPKQAPAAINAIWRGHTLMTPIGGGVTMNPTEALSSQNQLKDEQGKVAKTREELKINLAKGQWWWD